jgi:hypothetical protein
MPYCAELDPKNGYRPSVPPPDPKDLETLVTALEVAAILLTSKPGDTFTGCVLEVACTAPLGAVLSRESLAAHVERINEAARAAGLEPGR